MKYTVPAMEQKKAKTKETQGLSYEYPSRQGSPFPKGRIAERPQHCLIIPSGLASSFSTTRSAHKHSVIARRNG
jgi:hypothetical protein